MTDDITIQATSALYHDMPLDVYLADPCPQPSVSKGDLHTLYTSSPAHCWYAHPRLNPACPREDSKRADIGSAIHARIMSEERIRYGDYPDFRTKEARIWRDSVYAEKGVPILNKDRESIEGAAKAALAMLATYPGWGEYMMEHTMLWEKDGVWKRGRFDLFCPKANLMVDIKSCTSANPSAWIKTSLFSGGYDFQAEHYIEGAKVLGLANDYTAFLFLLVEMEPPHDCTFVGLDPRASDLVQRKIAVALSKWKRCVASGDWPGHGKFPHYAEVKDWQEAEVHEQALIESQYTTKE